MASVADFRYLFAPHHRWSTVMCNKVILQWICNIILQHQIMVQAQQVPKELKGCGAWESHPNLNHAALMVQGRES